MSSKEQLSRAQTVDGVFNKLDLKLLQLLWPGDVEIRVIKQEGDDIRTDKFDARIPDGHVFASVTLPNANVRKIWSEIEELKQQATAHAFKSQSSTVDAAVRLSDLKVSSGKVTLEEQTEIKVEVNGNTKELEPDRDSLGYLKTLNLSASDLETLSPEDLKLKIKHNYREAAFATHPDYGGNHDSMVNVNAAYEVISNPKSRHEYQTQTGQFAPKRF